MYSGTTLTPYSGKILGAHQKLDRVARKRLRDLLGAYDHVFPSTRAILKFEGKNGPDGIKRKSPAQDEPWHYLDPFNTKDTTLEKLIGDHHKSLISALKAKEATKAAFEAAWLAHALVDGLTPAHHFPYEAELKKLRSGKGLESRDTIMRKLIMPGESPTKQVANNWKMWGPKGLMSTHGSFELGVSMAIAPLRFTKAAPDEATFIELDEKGLIPIFRRSVRDIAGLDLYTEYYKTGWTPHLAQLVRAELAPTIIKMVCIAWYDACEQAHPYIREQA